LPASSQQESRASGEFAGCLRDDRQTDNGVAPEPERRSTGDAISANHVPAGPKEPTELAEAWSKRAHQQ